MSTTTAARTTGTSRRSTWATRRRRTRGRRRGYVALAVLAMVGVVAAVGLGTLGDAVREVTLPLRHDGIIRQQAAEKELDPALIAAVIYQESRFQNRTSSAGAKGLMQILPSTAQFIARRSGGTQFEIRDLANPEINIRYGAWYLRYLLGTYGGDATLAVAAYNAGHTNVDRWVAAAGGRENFDAKTDIHFPETRAYVQGVSERRRGYREHYAKELGL